MVHVNVPANELTCKLVYCGPGLSGKTTNLEFVHKKAPADRRGDLQSIRTEGDRTLFFDYLPFELGSFQGVAFRLQLYTVPGQSFYAATRKLVLQGADGIAFVADSRPGALQDNLDALSELHDTLRDQGRDPQDLPIVFQWNKRDLPDAIPTPELEAALNPHNKPSIRAVASQGNGVLRTLKSLASLVLKRVQATYGLKPQPEPSTPIPTPAAHDQGLLKDVRLELARAPKPPQKLTRPAPALRTQTFVETLPIAHPETQSLADPWSRSLELDAPEDPNDPVVGQDVGGCRIRAKLGEGGMGAVYLAHHQGLNQSLVVKVLKPEYAQSPRRVQRFFREAKAAAKLDHSNIVRVQDVGTNERGLHFIIMQYVEGQNLLELVRDHGPQPHPDALRIIADCTRALICIHQHGIIHRDIKAENVILTTDHQVKLIDFGLAKDLNAEYSLTRPGALLGTPVYMAPEIGRVERIDGRVDIYSLGLTLYFLLTGTPPFRGHAIHEVIFGRAKLTPLRELRPDLPEALETLLLNMIAWDRDERFPNAQALLDALEALLPTPTTANTPPSSHRLQAISDSVPPSQDPLTHSPTLQAEVDAARKLPRNRFGRFTLLQELDRDPGSLHRAWDPEHRRQVTIRILDDAQATPRRDHELHGLAKLRHPHLQSLLTHTRHDQRLALVHSYTETTPLDKLTGAPHDAEDALQPLEAARILADAARALSVVHQRGYTHPWLRPSSIHVDPTGRGLLTELGLSPQPPRLTSPRRSPRRLRPHDDPFLAPETAQPSGDPRSDVYALGAVLYLALTGRPPQRRRALVPPSLLAPHLPLDLDHVCARALSLDPNTRYPTADALADDLERILNHEPLNLPTPSTPTTPSRTLTFDLPSPSFLITLTLLALVSLFAWHQTRVARAQAAVLEAMIGKLETAQAPAAPAAVDSD